MSTQIKRLKVDASHLQLLHKVTTTGVPSFTAIASEVGCCVGACVCKRSSFSICINVVLPALSSPCHSNTQAILPSSHQPEIESLHSCCKVPNNSTHCRTFTQQNNPVTNLHFRHATLSIRSRPKLSTHQLRIHISLSYDKSIDCRSR